MDILTNILTGIIVVAAALAVVWQLTPALPRYRFIKGLAERLGHGIMDPLVRRAEKGLGSGCTACSAHDAKTDARARHARTPR